MRRWIGIARRQGCGCALRDGGRSDGREVAVDADAGVREGGGEVRLSVEGVRCDRGRKKPQGGDGGMPMEEEVEERGVLRRQMDDSERSSSCRDHAPFLYPSHAHVRVHIHAHVLSPSHDPTPFRVSCSPSPCLHPCNIQH